MKTIKVNNYECIIGFDINKETVQEKINEASKDVNKVLLVIDEKVSKEYQDKVKEYFDKYFVLTIVYKASEKAKTLNTYEKIVDLMLKYSFSRKDLICAVGGGVTCDLVGYVASTYKRGIKDIYFPTTTLAMIDASVGGKVALNFGSVKNAIGTFYDPSLVIMDLNSLNSLDKRNYNNGLVEGIKMGLTLNKNLYNLFKEDTFDIENIIVESVETKKEIVERDKYDKGVREILNFGHAYAHAIELETKYLHGECVALGMINNILNENIKKEVIDILLNKMGIDIKKMQNDIKNKKIDYSNDKKTSNNVLRESYLLDIENVEYKNINI